MIKRLTIYGGLGAAVVVLVVVALGMGRLGLIVVLGLAGALVLSLIPIHILPALCLAVWALVPRRLAVEVLGVDIVYPLAFVMGVWVVRMLLTRPSEPSERRSRAWLSAVLVLLAVWLAFVTLVGREWGQSLTWVVAFLLLLAAPAMLAERNAVDALVATWLGLAVLLGLYAFVEAALQQNVVYGRLLPSLDGEEAQRWSVYRVNASFGHPLYASLFFSSAFGLALGRFVERPGKRLAIVAAISGAAMVTTVSRSGLAATVVAAAAVLMLAVVRARSIPGIAKLGLVAATTVGVALATTSGAFAERSSSGEASSSSDAREWVISLALEAAARSGWIGTGPGTSADAVRALDSYQILVENGYLQLLVSIGIVGAGLFVVLLIASVAVAIRRHRYGALGALISLGVSIAGFNALESNPSMMILFGGALALVWVAPAAKIDDDATIGAARLVRSPSLKAHR